MFLPFANREYRQPIHMRAVSEFPVKTALQPTTMFNLLPATEVLFFALARKKFCSIVASVLERGWALGAVVALLLYTEKVAGSNPAVPTIPPV